MPQVWVLMVVLIPCGNGSNLSLQALNVNWEGANKAKWYKAREEKAVAGKMWENRTAECFPKTIIFFLLVCFMQLKPSVSLNKPSCFNGCDVCSVYMLSIKVFLPSHLPSNPLYDYAFFFFLGLTL